MKAALVACSLVLGVVGIVLLATGASRIVGIIFATIGGLGATTMIGWTGGVDADGNGGDGG
jgi:hypothetical protein